MRNASIRENLDVWNANFLVLWERTIVKVTGAADEIGWYNTETNLQVQAYAAVRRP